MLHGHPPVWRVAHRTATYWAITRAELAELAARGRARRRPLAAPAGVGLFTAAARRPRLTALIAGRATRRDVARGARGPRRPRDHGPVLVDVAIVGAGGAGSSLLVHLDRLLPAGGTPPSIAVVDPVRHAGRDRTWCFWDDGASPVEGAVHRSWGEVLLVDGAARRAPARPRTAAVRHGQVAGAVRAGRRCLRAARRGPRDGTGRRGDRRSRVRTGAAGERRGARAVGARLPARRAPAAGDDALLQHFRGWTVRFGADVLDPTAPVFMDFTVPQPARGVAFGYVLPDDASTGLVEYTEFSRDGSPRPPTSGICGATCANAGARRAPRVRTRSRTSRTARYR